MIARLKGIWSKPPSRLSRILSPFIGIALALVLQGAIQALLL